ncbi:MAG: hypothetical protein ACR2H1_10290, partial [Limisphaerales bacterium]
ISSFDAATDIQARKLRFFDCWWRGQITKAQAEAEISKRVKRYPEREKEWQNCPATPEQLRQLKKQGELIKSGMTYLEAMNLILSLALAPSIETQDEIFNEYLPPCEYPSEQEKDLMQEKLRFFGYRCEGEISYWQLAAGIRECEGMFPEREKEWKNRPPTLEQARQLADFGHEIESGLTSLQAKHLIVALTLRHEIDFLEKLGFDPKNQDASLLIIRVLRPVNFALSSTFKKISSLPDQGYSLLQIAIAKSEFCHQLPRYGPNSTWNELEHRPLTKEERMKVTDVAFSCLPPEMFLSLQSNGVKKYKDQLDAKLKEKCSPSS